MGNIFEVVVSKCAPQDYILLAFAVLCAVTDAGKKKIYNWATFPAIIIGLGLGFIYGGLRGAGAALAGAAAGFFILYFFWAAGGVGAGDVKFLMGVGALKGVLFAVKGAISGIFVAGIATILWMTANGVFVRSLKNVLIPLYTSFVSGFKISPMPTTKSPTLPFGFYLAVGVIGYWFYGML